MPFFANQAANFVSRASYNISQDNRPEIVHLQEVLLVNIHKFIFRIKSYKIEILMLISLMMLPTNSSSSDELSSEAYDPADVYIDDSPIDVSADYCAPLRKLTEYEYENIFLENVQPAKFLKVVRNVRTAAEQMLADQDCDMWEFNVPIFMVDSMLRQIIPNHHYAKKQIRILMQLRKKLMNIAIDKFDTWPCEIVAPYIWFSQLECIKDGFTSQTKRHRVNINVHR